MDWLEYHIFIDSLGKGDPGKGISLPVELRLRAFELSITGRAFAIIGSCVVLGRTRGLSFEYWVSLSVFKLPSIYYEMSSLTQHGLDMIIVGGTSLKSRLLNFKSSEERWIVIHCHLSKVFKLTTHVLLHCQP